PFSIDPRKLLFSVTTFVAAALVLLISFAVSFPRPWWALLTVYVTAQPMAGTFRPKTIYRVAGIATGAIVTVAVAPN
ncbi:FUSC family protein, partial [Cupriavidus sp. SIMBA_020]